MDDEIENLAVSEGLKFIKSQGWPTLSDSNNAMFLRAAIKGFLAASRVSNERKLLIAVAKATVLTGSIPPALMPPGGLLGILEPVIDMIRSVGGDEVADEIINTMQNVALRK